MKLTHENPPTKICKTEHFIESILSFLSWPKGMLGAKHFMMLGLLVAEENVNKPTGRHTDRHADRHTDRQDSCFRSIDIVHILIDK